MSKLIPAFILLAGIWFLSTVAALEADMPLEDSLNKTVLGKNVADGSICADEKDFLKNSTSQQGCQEKTSTSPVKYYHFIYGFIGVAGFLGGIIFLRIGLAALFWLIWLIG